MIKYFFLFLFAFIFTANSFAEEKLLIIQSVSSDKKSFIIQVGRDQGLGLGKKYLFSTPSVSLVAKVIEINKDFSLWVVEDKESTVPFKKEDFVRVSSFTEYKQQQLALTRIETEQKKKEADVLAESFWKMRGSFVRSLSESVSETAPNQTLGRSGYSIELLYSKLLTSKWEYAIGVRYDNESARLENPALDIPTTRVGIVGEINYRLGTLGKSNNFFYFGAGAGIARSQTVVDESVSTGMATIFPVVRVGFENPNSVKSSSFLAELVVEGISAKESFTDGPEQTTTIVAGKVSLGLKF